MASEAGMVDGVLTLSADDALELGMVVKPGCGHDIAGRGWGDVDVDVRRRDIDIRGLGDVDGRRKGLVGTRGFLNKRRISNSSRNRFGWN